MREGKAMDRIQVILKSGEETTFETDDNFSLSDCDNDFYCLPNGNKIMIDNNEIAAVIKTKMMKCSVCGKWTVPKVINYYGSNDEKGTECKYEEKVCEYCGTDI